MSTAVNFTEACRRIGMSVSTGHRLRTLGKFPIPSLPKPLPNMHPRYSTVEIDLWLADASTADVKPRMRVVR